MLYRLYDDNSVNAVRGVRGMKSVTGDGIGHQLTRARLARTRN